MWLHFKIHAKRFSTRIHNLEPSSAFHWLRNYPYKGQKLAKEVLKDLRRALCFWERRPVESYIVLRAIVVLRNGEEDKQVLVLASTYHFPCSIEKDLMHSPSL